MRNHALTLDRRQVVVAQSYAPVVILALVTAVGLYLRLVQVVASDFPLNDGGLFYLMAQEIRDAHYALPDFTSYNSAGIPFAYPPLSFYVAAFTADVTGWPLIDIIRLLPALIGGFTIPLVYILSRAILKSSVQATFAAFAFAMLPASFHWYIMGGGITRSTGVFLALVTLYQAYLLYTRQQWRFAWSTTLFASLTMLSHPEVSWFMIFSTVLFFLFYGMSRDAVLKSLAVAGGVLALTSPWWVTILNRHGVSPFLSASQTGSPSLMPLASLLRFDFGQEQFIGLLSVMALLGIFVSIAKRELLPPVWLAAILFLSPRTGTSYSMVPLSMLAALGMDQLILPAISRLDLGRGLRTTSDDTGTARLEAIRQPQWLRGVLPKVALGYFAGYALLSGAALIASKPLGHLPAEERQAMAWVASNTPQDSRFLLMTGTNPWVDSTSEWFPVLAQRRSLATHQGLEWLPGQYNQFIKMFFDVQKCSLADAACLDNWTERSGLVFTYVYLRKEPAGPLETCCTLLERSLVASPDYALVYDGAGAMIFARRSTSSSPHDAISSGYTEHVWR